MLNDPSLLNLERLPLRGCLHPDGHHYSVSYVTAAGRVEDCDGDEARTLRQIKPFQNTLRFARKTRDVGQYKFRRDVGEGSFNA